MLDYALFRRILEELYDYYPKNIFSNQLVSLKSLPNNVREKNLWYLAEHDFITKPIQVYPDGECRVCPVGITKNGIDFLQPDGGLSALAAPVIRIAPESFFAVIDQALTAHGCSREQRGIIQKGLGIAGSEGVKVIIQRLIDAGITHAPDIVKLFTLP